VWEAFTVLNTRIRLESNTRATLRVRALVLFSIEFFPEWRNWQTQQTQNRKLPHCKQETWKKRKEVS